MGEGPRFLVSTDTGGLGEDGCTGIEVSTKGAGSVNISNIDAAITIFLF